MADKPARRLTHPLLPGEEIFLAGDDEDDATPEQEMQLAATLARIDQERARLVDVYSQALLRQDLDTIASILRLAEQDTELDRLIIARNAALHAELEREMQQ